MFTSHNRFTGGDFTAGKTRSQRAFTLLEVMGAMGILMLLTGALFAMVDASIRGASELETRGNRLQQESGFLALCRQTFHGLPATASFEVRIVQQGQNFVPELVFRNCPGLFQWGDANNMSFSTIVGVRSQIGGLFNLSILQDSENEINSYLNGGTAKRSWLVLMPDLRDVQWRFYDPRAQTWAKEWKEVTFRPSFAELTLTNETGTGKYVFWLPPVQSSIALQ